MSVGHLPRVDGRQTPGSGDPRFLLDGGAAWGPPCQGNLFLSRTQMIPRRVKLRAIPPGVRSPRRTTFSQQSIPSTTEKPVQFPRANIAPFRALVMQLESLLESATEAKEIEMWQDMLKKLREKW